MKKIYLAPEMEIVNVETQQMLAASLPLNGTESVTDPEEILAPGMLDMGPSLPGIPTFVFE